MPMTKLPLTRRSLLLGTAASAAAGGTLVRDRVCNKFLPRSRALSAEVGGEQFFFCSDGCRRQFLSRS